jgi:hypothetical protein
MQTRIDGMQDLNKQDYLRNIAEQIITSCGSPADWGAVKGAVPNTFGLSSSDSSHLYELDIDKITRLNSQNNYSLSYGEVSQAARLNNIALGISVSQILTIAVTPYANSTSADTTTYTFMISVSQAQSPISASLHCYVIARGFLTDVSNTTSHTGVGYITIQVPNSVDGPALLVVFARASFDDRLTSYDTYAFAHQSQEPSPNNGYLGLSPLDYTLNVNPNSSETTIEDGYAFSYDYQSNLTSTSNTTYAIPAFLDRSPTVLVISGVNGTAPFVEWTSYPNVPLKFGANFENSEENVFVYTVIIRDTLYKLTLTFGDVIK